jgi:indole-3-glycerol phosphate synthase
MNILSEITAKKRERVAAARAAVPLDQMRREVATPHALRKALSAQGINIIAEFKRRSPSKGMIRAEADLIQMVQSYEAGGAAAISVLTEEDYFDGSLDDLRAVKSAVKLPVLRKDLLLKTIKFTNPPRLVPTRFF